MREVILAAGLLVTPACGDSAAPPAVRVVDLDALKAELPRALGRGALVNLWAMW